MGQVYQATDTKLNRQVALKILPEVFAADPDRLARFQREAQVLASLNHPGIAAIYGIEEAEDTRALVLELVEGSTLAERIAQGPIPVDEALPIAKQIAEALEAAHEAGVIHRDLKPANIKVREDGTVKVLDFGLAKAVDTAPQSDPDQSPTLTAAATQMGVIMGTAAYMSPEQARGKPVDKRADIWAFGVVLYEMLTGRKPFPGADVSQTLARVIDSDPNWDVLPKTLAPALGTYLRRCLQKGLRQRVRDIGDVRLAIDGAYDLPGAAPVDSAPLSRWSRWRVVAAATVLVAAFAGGYQLRAPEPAPATVLRLRDPVQVTSGPGLIERPVWSPDSATVAYHNQGNGDIWVTPIGGQSLNRTSDHDGEDREPTWSPDGSEIAFFSTRSGRGIFRMSALAGAPSKVSSAEGGRDPHWLADGAQLAYAINSLPGNTGDLGDIEVVTLESDERQRLQLPGTWRRRFQLSWSPDERYVAYVDKNAFLSDISQLWIYRFSDGEAIAVTEASTWNESPSWSPDGRTLYFVSNRGGGRDLWQQRLSVDGALAGEPERVTVGVGMWRASLSPDGTKLAYVRGGRISNVWRSPILPDRPATWPDAEQLTSGRAYVSGLDVSPDGSQVAFASDRNGNLDLWILPTSGGEMRQLTANSTLDMYPRWSPNGERVVFQAQRSGNWDLWAMPSSGGLATQLTTHQDSDMFPDVSPDGTEVVHRTIREGVLGLQVIDLETRDRRSVDQIAIGPDWSSDGEWFAFWTCPDELCQVFRSPSDGGERESLAPGQETRWSSDGRDIYFVRERNGAWVLSLDSRTERQLLDLSGRTGGIVFESFATDEEYLYFVWQEDQGDVWVVDVVPDSGSGN